MNSNKQAGTMLIGSLIDASPNDYIGVYSTITGELIKHIYNRKESPVTQEKGQTVGPEETQIESYNEKQINLF